MALGFGFALFYLHSVVPKEVKTADIYWGSLPWVGLQLIMVAANAPGHLSYDSVVQLFEGRHGVRQTWAPPLQSWLMGIFDEIVPGTGLYIAAIGLVLTAALASMVRLRDRSSWAAVTTPATWSHAR